MSSRGSAPPLEAAIEHYRAQMEQAVLGGHDAVAVSHAGGLTRTLEAQRGRLDSEQLEEAVGSAQRALVWIGGLDGDEHVISETSLRAAEAAAPLLEPGQLSQVRAGAFVGQPRETNEAVLRTLRVAFEDGISPSTRDAAAYELSMLGRRVTSDVFQGQSEALDGEVLQAAALQTGDPERIRYVEEIRSQSEPIPPTRFARAVTGALEAGRELIDGVTEPFAAIYDAGAEGGLGAAASEYVDVMVETGPVGMIHGAVSTSRDVAAAVIDDPEAALDSATSAVRSQADAVRARFENDAWQASGYYLAAIGGGIPTRGRGITLRHDASPRNSEAGAAERNTAHPRELDAQQADRPDGVDASRPAMSHAQIIERRRQFMTDPAFARAIADEYYRTGVVPEGFEATRAYRHDTRNLMGEDGRPHTGFEPNPDRSWQTGQSFVHVSGSRWDVQKYLPYATRYGLDPEVHRPGERALIGEINIYEVDVVGVRAGDLDELNLPELSSLDYPAFEDVVLTPYVPSSHIRSHHALAITGEVVDAGSLPPGHPFFAYEGQHRFPHGETGLEDSDTTLSYHALRLEPATERMRRPAGDRYIIDRRVEDR